MSAKRTERTAAMDGLSIKQTAELYGITIDTLYYYEKVGLVVPERNASNGYRVYTTQNFGTLNIIKAMLEMDFTLSQAKDFLSSHYLDSNISLLRTELANLNDLLGRLRSRQKGVESALIRYTQALMEAPEERVKLVELPARPILSLGQMPAQTSSLPFLTAVRGHELGVSINIFHVQPLFTITTKVNDEGTYDGIKAYLYSESELGVEDEELPAGSYLSATFRGSAQRTPEFYERMKDIMRDQSLKQLGNPIEFWTVNEYVSDDETEYIHTLQVRVERRDHSA